MLRVWNVTLVIVTFFLTIVGTFLTRSGVVESVHAFGKDPILTKMFVVFMIAILIFSFSLVIYRLPLLRARNDLESWASREAAFLVNNWILLFCAFFVLFTVMFPTLTEAITGERVTLGPPFFNKWMPPIGLVLMFLTGTGPLLAWRKSTLGNIRDQFLWPFTFAILVGLTWVGLTINAAVVLANVWISGAAFALCGFVTGTVVQEYWRGTNVRKKNSGSDFLTALIGLVSRNKRRYGGYIVHLGIVLIMIGFAGKSYEKESSVRLLPLEQTTLGRYALRYDTLKVTDDGQKQMVTAQVTILKDGREVDKLYPARWFYRKHEGQPTTEVGISRSVAEDFYVTLGAYEMGPQSVHLELHVNPLVDWVWLGFGIMAIGTGIALLPETVFSFALAKLPAGAATTAVLLLVLLMPAGLRARTTIDQADPAGLKARATTVQAEAVSGQSQSVAPDAIPALELEMQGQIMCMCGGCRAPLNDCPMPTCHSKIPEKEHLHELVAQGQSRDAIIASFVKEYGGQDVLAAPIDKGFNRLAWAFPYLVGLVSAILVGFTAVRLTRRRDEAGTPAPEDPALEERLDDELRDLD